MTEDTSPKSPKEVMEKATPIGRMTIGEVDAALADCDKTIKNCSDVVKAKLASNASLPTNVLRDLSKANAHKGKLMMPLMATQTPPPVATSNSPTQSAV